jgi:hypothetical protein
VRAWQGEVLESPPPPTHTMSQSIIQVSLHYPSIVTRWMAWKALEGVQDDSVNILCFVRSVYRIYFTTYANVHSML